MGTVVKRCKMGLALLFLAVGVFGVPYVAADSSTYGMGDYGSCTYNSCGVSLTSSGNVSINITPSTGTVCTVASDSVAVTTDSSSGYTLTLVDGDTSNALAGAVNGGSIAASSATAGSPAALTSNHWGYRVDSLGSFGAGPTSALSNGSIPSVTFAAVPLSSGTADTIATTTGPADPAVTTTVWYGACANSSLVSDTYTDGVIYTAVVN